MKLNVGEATRERSFSISVTKTKEGRERKDICFSERAESAVPGKDLIRDGSAPRRGERTLPGSWWCTEGVQAPCTAFVCTLRVRTRRETGIRPGKAWPIRPEHEESVWLTRLRRFYGIENVPTKRSGNRVNKPNLRYVSAIGKRGTIAMILPAIFLFSPSVSLLSLAHAHPLPVLLFFFFVSLCARCDRFSPGAPRRAAPNPRSNPRSRTLGGNVGSLEKPFPRGEETGEKRSPFRKTWSREGAFSSPACFSRPCIAREHAWHCGDTLRAALSSGARVRQSRNNILGLRAARRLHSSRDTGENYNNWLDYRWDMVMGSARLSRLRRRNLDSDCV